MRSKNKVALAEELSIFGNGANFHAITKCLYIYVIQCFPPLGYQPDQADNLNSSILNGERLLACM